MDSVFVWIGLVLSSFAWAVVIREQVPFLTGPVVHVTGTVLGHAATVDSDGTSFRANIGFADLDGKPQVFADVILSGTPTPAPGKQVTVLYPARRPDLARVAHPVIRIGIHIVLAFLTGILVARLAGWLS